MNNAALCRDAATGPTCCYLVRDDLTAKSAECGAPATHRSAKAKQLFLCAQHAAHIERFGKFKLQKLDAALCRDAATPKP